MIFRVGTVFNSDLSAHFISAIRWFKFNLGPGGCGVHS